MRERVLLGFSGGVDSAVAALLLREEGCAVEAAFMAVRGRDGHGCGAAGDAEAAEALARELGLPFRVVDCSAAYAEAVLGNFRAEYLAGRTPNPCVVCNRLVKFDVLPRRAAEAGARFDLFATGHYARVAYSGAAGRHVLLRGRDASKDQSYFLHRLTADQLARVRFPLGDMTKRETRALAAARGVPVSEKPDSQDFYGGDYAELLGAPGGRGDIVDVSGRVLGEHDGYFRFTPGQRKGLGVAFSEPLYVLRTEPERNRVVVGTKAEELSRACVVADWVAGAAALFPGLEALGRIRSAQPLRPMRVAAVHAGGEALVEFAAPAQGVAPGQSLVLYDGDTVLGGGVIRGRGA